MALTTEHKLYVGLGLLGALGIGYYLQHQEKQEEAKVLSAETQKAALPELKLTEDVAKKVDKIEITTPAEDEDKDTAKAKDDKKKDKKPKQATKVVLKKQGEEWSLVEPVKASANQNNVKSIIDGLPKLEIKEVIDGGTGRYDEYEVSDKKAIHVVIYQGDKKLTDLYVGKSGGRGQMVRVAGQDGVFKLEGFSSWTYKREVKGWRDVNVFKVDEKKIKSLEIANENGVFTFAKEGDAWKGKHKAPKGGDAKPIPDFDPSKVDDMVRAYKNLNATDFGDDKQPSDVGLVAPIATVTIVLDDGARRVVMLGNNSDGDARWAIKEGSSQIFVLSSWSANWATAKVEKFQKKKDDDKKGDDKKDAPAGDEDLPDLGGADLGGDE